MNNNLEKDIISTLKLHDLNCTTHDFLNNVNDVHNKINWYWISIKKPLSEKFLITFKYNIFWKWLICANYHIPINKITNESTSYHQIHNNIYIYENSDKNKRYLFLKNMDYEEINSRLISFHV